MLLHHYQTIYLLHISSGFLNPYWSNYNDNFWTRKLVLLEFFTAKLDYIGYKLQSIDNW